MKDDRQRQLEDSYRFLFWAVVVAVFVMLVTLFSQL